MKRTRIDTSSLAHHLWVAGERYAEHGAQFRGMAEGRQRIADSRADMTEAANALATAEGYRRIAEQFEQHAEEARTWSEALNNQERLEVDGDRLVVVV